MVWASKEVYTKKLKPRLLSCFNMPLLFLQGVAFLYLLILSGNYYFSSFIINIAVTSAINMRRIRSERYFANYLYKLHKAKFMIYHSLSFLKTLQI